MNINFVFTLFSLVAPADSRDLIEILDMSALEFVVIAVHSFGKHDSAFDVGNKTDTEVNSGTPHDVSRCDLSLDIGSITNIDKKINLL